MGLERLAMVLFAIPDIRLFWTDDERFTSQFKAGKIVKFNSYSKYPLCYKDVSFWLPENGLHPNDVYEVSQSVPSHCLAHLTAELPTNTEKKLFLFCRNGFSTQFYLTLNVRPHQLIRNETGDIVERVELLDQFTNKKTGKESHAYRCQQNITN